ncbi:MAG: winged helix-turn-helix domain-containing protein [Candidatus Tyrphobacter sp.]
MTNTNGRGLRREGRRLRQGFALFGTPTRSGVLVLLALLDESYPRELARLLGAGLFAVQSAVEGLESDGAIASRLVGRTRRVVLNPRFYGAAELKALLIKVSSGQRQILEAAASIRPRPRRRGKPL